MTVKVRTRDPRAEHGRTPVTLLYRNIAVGPGAGTGHSRFRPIIE